MSFKETDFIGIIGYLKGLLKTQKDPILFKAMVAKLVDIYDTLPVYPGLVNMCISQAQKVIKPEELKKGQNVFVETDEGFISGVVSKTGKKLTLKKVQVLSEEKTIEIDISKIKQVAYINEDVVKDLWPSLVFDKEQNQ